MTLREAAEALLKDVEEIFPLHGNPPRRDWHPDSLDALRAALAQPEGRGGVCVVCQQPSTGSVTWFTCAAHHPQVASGELPRPMLWLAPPPRETSEGACLRPVFSPDGIYGGPCHHLLGHGGPHEWAPPSQGTEP